MVNIEQGPEPHVPLTPEQWALIAPLLEPSEEPLEEEVAS